MEAGEGGAVLTSDFLCGIIGGGRQSSLNL